MAPGLAAPRFDTKVSWLPSLPVRCWEESSFEFVDLLMVTERWWFLTVRKETELIPLGFEPSPNLGHSLSSLKMHMEWKGIEDGKQAGMKWRKRESKLEGR